MQPYKDKITTVKSKIEVINRYHRVRRKPKIDDRWTRETKEQILKLYFHLLDNINEISEGI